MTQPLIEQAIYSRTEDEAVELQARSAGFRDGWLAEVGHTLHDYDIPPVGTRCPSAVFALPLGRRHVMVVHFAERDAGTPRKFGSHVLVVPRTFYAGDLHDPFLIAEKIPPDWDARLTMPSAEWTWPPVRPRTVAQVREVLQRVKVPVTVTEDGSLEVDPVENAESPALLGGVQLLVDGGRLIFERPRPDTDLLRALWLLLPRSTRGEVWPASFAFNNRLPFDVLVVPRLRLEELPGYTTEDQAADYPEGNYERSLQVAAEAGDQGELDALFGRRSWAETWKLGMTLLVGMCLLLLANHLLFGPMDRPQGPPLSRAEVQSRTEAAVAVVGLGDPLGAAFSWPLVRESFLDPEQKTLTGAE